MLHFKTNSSEIFSPNGKIEANFYANIPMHNVTNLMEAYKTKEYDKVFDIIIKDP